MPCPRHVGSVEPPHRVRERGPRHVADPPRTHDLAGVGLSDDHRGPNGSAASSRSRPAGEVRPVRRPRQPIPSRDPVQVGSLGDLPQADSLGQRRIRVREWFGQTDDDGLLLLRLESGGAQPIGEVGRLVVPVELPLHRLARSREHVSLPRDQRVQLAGREIGDRDVGAQEPRSSGRTRASPARPAPGLCRPAVDPASRRAAGRRRCRAAVPRSRSMLTG